MADIRVTLRHGGASLETIARELAGMTDTKVCGFFRARLDPAARAVLPAVRASVMAIPTKGEVPYHQPPGLRARIAACAEVASGQEPRSAWVSIWMNPSRMPPGQMSLPQMMEGEKRFRHPVFGRRDNPHDWVMQTPHPYFYQAAAALGPLAGQAVESALDDITRQISG
jgi:hypothetical protein